MKWDLDRSIMLPNERIRNERIIKREDKTGKFQIIRIWIIIFNLLLLSNQICQINFNPNSSSKVETPTTYNSLIIKL